MLTKGGEAPDFEAELDDGSSFRLSALRGRKHVVLYFYPKDFSSGCTRQACAFRDNYGDIARRDAMIVGVSTDSDASHRGFRERHSLPFPMIADPDKRLHRLYDATALFGLLRARVTYVIDKAGVIRAALRHDLAIGRHLDGVLETLRRLEPPAG